MTSDPRTTAPKAELVFLGTGTPRINPNRKATAQAIIFNNEAFLIDCGSGAMYQAATAFEQGIEPLKPTLIHHIFLTHLHSDHCLGLAEMIFAPWVVGRKKPISIFGPPGTQAMIQSLIKAYEADIKVRINGLETLSIDALEPIVYEIESGDIFQIEGMAVQAFDVHHGNWPYAFGFKFLFHDKKVVFSGDTCPCEGIRQAAKDVDILIHEVYAHSAARAENRAGGEKWPQYMQEFHTSSLELGVLAAWCRVKILIVNHVVRGSESDADLVQEIRQGGYQGEVIVAKDLDSFSV